MSACIIIEKQESVEYEITGSEKESIYIDLGSTPDNPNWVCVPLDYILTVLRDNGYKVDFDSHDVLHYGLPLKR